MKDQDIQKLEVPPMPRRISGLKKDGSRDKRFRKGFTVAEIIEYVDSMSGEKAKDL